MTKQLYSLEAVTKLKASLPLGPDFLGMARPATIGGINVSVILPHFSFNKPTSALRDGSFEPFFPPHLKRVPDIKIDWIEHYAQLSETEQDLVGRVTKWNPRKSDGGIELFHAARVAMFSKNKITKAQGQKLLHETDVWKALLNLWVEVVSKTDLSESGVEANQHGQETDIVLNRRSYQKELFCKHPTEMTVKLSTPLTLTPLQWRKILVKASNSESPPESHRFLVDARRELNAKRYRRSVLDSATATEIALIKLRDDVLKKRTTSRMATYVQKRSDQIGRLVDFHETAGRFLPGDIKREIASPRNKAIHEGKEPMPEVAKTALIRATEVVDMAFAPGKLLQ